MNPLELALNEYIAIRRALGFELREVAGCLRNFVAFLKIEGASHITKELALRWATQPADAQPYTWAWRLGMVRRFAAWHSAMEPRTEVPAPGLLPQRYQRKTPHIEHRWQQRPVKANSGEEVQRECAAPLVVIQHSESTARRRRAADDMDDDVYPAEPLQNGIGHRRATRRCSKICGHK
jgi:hypothetical protein